MSELLKSEGCFGEFDFSVGGKSGTGGFLNLLISFSYDKDEPPKKVLDELETIGKRFHMFLTRTKIEYYTRKFKYVKTYEEFISEDMSGQILAGNTASGAEMNVNMTDKQAGKGDAIDFWYSPNGKDPAVRAHGKILSIRQTNGESLYHITLNVEGSPFNKKGVRDESNAVDGIRLEQIIGPYAGLRNPTGSGFVSQNTNIDVVAKTGGQAGASDGTANFGASNTPTDNSGFGL